MNVQFCAGGHNLPGFENKDMDCDIRNPLPYNDNSVTMAYCSHGAEHINSHEGLRFFQEVHRILKPGGVFRVVVPTLEKITSREHARDLILGHGHAQVFSKESLRDILWAAGFDRESIAFTEKDPRYDWHGRTIGEDKDNQESCWVEATK